jgi:hypothetical protein
MSRGLRDLIFLRAPKIHPEKSPLMEEEVNEISND